MSTSRKSSQSKDGGEGLVRDRGGESLVEQASEGKECAAPSSRTVDPILPEEGAEGHAHQGARGLQLHETRLWHRRKRSRQKEKDELIPPSQQRRLEEKRTILTFLLPPPPPPPPPLCRLRKLLSSAVKCHCRHLT